MRLKGINLTLGDEICSECTEMYSPMNNMSLIMHGIDMACLSVSDQSGNLTNHFFRSEAGKVLFPMKIGWLLSLPALSDDISHCTSFPSYFCLCKSFQ